VAANKALKKLDLADNQFNEDDAVLEEIQRCMKRNKNLTKYVVKHNDLKDKGKLSIGVNLLFLAITFFIEMLGPEEEEKISHVVEIEVSERAGKILTDEGPPEVYTPLIKLLKEKLAGNKPKKGKKGKKGKKKKKK
jgi:hypothetical protein